MTTSFEDLYARHYHKTFLRAYSLLRCVQDAEEATADAFVQLWRHLPEVIEYKVTTWLYTVVTHKAIDRLRQRTLELAHFTPLNEEIDIPVEDDTETRLDALAEIRARIALLPPVSAQIVLMRGQDYSYKEIGASLSLSYRAVKERAYRARMQLQEARIA